MLLRVPSNLTLNTSREGASTASQHCLPRDSGNQAPKQAKVYPPEVQGGGSAKPPPNFSKN